VTTTTTHNLSDITDVIFAMKIAQVLSVLTPDYKTNKQIQKLVDEKCTANKQPVISKRRLYDYLEKLVEMGKAERRQEPRLKGIVFSYRRK
jgi:hypothetical protein